MSQKNGTRFIDKLIAASPTERRKFTVLGQDIYVRPLTRAAINEAMPKDGVERAPDYVGLFLIVHAAESADGEKLFRTQDIEALRTKVSSSLLQEIESGVLGVLAPNKQQVAEAVAADPPSASA